MGAVWYPSRSWFAVTTNLPISRPSRPKSCGKWLKNFKCIVVKFSILHVKEIHRLRNMPVSEVLRDVAVSEVVSTKVVVQEPPADVYLLDSRCKFIMQLTIQLTAKSCFAFHFPVSEHLALKSDLQGRLREN